MATITVNGNTVDPTANELTSDDASNSNFIIIQTKHDLYLTEKEKLADLKVEIQEYVAENTYLCRFKPVDLEPIRALTDFIQSVNVYSPQLKVTSSLKDMVERVDGQTMYEVDLLLHQDPNLTPAQLAPRVANIAGVPLDQLGVAKRKIRLTVLQDKLAELATLDSVNRIEEVREKMAFNNLARGILRADADSFSQSTGYKGAGQLVCVADGGFDLGLKDADKVHQAFGDRVHHLDALWFEKDDKGAGGTEEPACDKIGHGTHVAGSILGSGTYTSKSGEKISVHGTAPEARLMDQSMRFWSKTYAKWGLKAPLEIDSLFLKAYNLGARIHNNSWGDVWDRDAPDGQLGYGEDATDVDRFVFEHEDFVVLIAAGNDARESNAAAGQISDNGAAKNCITVGATGTTRGNDGEKYWSNQPAKTKVKDTAVFSSRGPTKSEGGQVLGRIKPDVVAPGVVILSAASQAMPSDPDAKERTRNGRCEDPSWLYLSGTSMATPLVSGCVALLREALQKQGKRHPGAALIKALLVNGAVNYSSKTNEVFDYQQGFGRVDIDSSISMVHHSTYVDGGNNFEQSAQDVPALRITSENMSDPARIWTSPEIPAPQGRNKIAVSLAYSDFPGALLQNDLNLIVRSGGMERHGNMGSESGFDRTNNVEKVIWVDAPGPTVQIVVHAYAFTKPLESPEQAFAVVWDVREG